MNFAKLSRTAVLTEHEVAAPEKNINSKKRKTCICYGAVLYSKAQMSSKSNIFYLASHENLHEKS